MIHLVRVTKENVHTAVRLQNTIFPEYNGEANYMDSIEGRTDSKYSIVYDGDTCVGITGLYTYSEDPASA